MKINQEPTMAELEVEDKAERYRTGRADAFDHGKPETILRYWAMYKPTTEELHTIIRNMLDRMTGAGI